MGTFDYENAELDILDNGGDPDYLNYYNQDKRDAYLKSINLNPDDYKSEKGSGAPHGSSGGCYVATCVYGSYDSPQVLTLRSFRDQRLAKTMPGRAFIKAYYSVSPHLVRKFGSSRSFHRICKAILDPFVRHLERGDQNN